jgi:DNA-binding CsgD family transcriptional regulator
MGVRSLLESASAFAAECERMATMDELARGVCALVAPFGYPNVASGRVGRSGAPETFHFAQWDPEWVKLYMRRDFLRIDPVPLWALRCGTPIGAAELRALLPAGHPAHTVFNEGRRFGITGGYIVPQRAPDNTLGAVAFIGASDPEGLEDRFALRALAGVIFDRAEALCGRAEPNFIPHPPPELTHRERECLAHLIAGRSTAHIANAMKVSEATVRFHAGNLKVKTGAANRAELAAVAISLGLALHRSPAVKEE